MADDRLIPAGIRDISTLAINELIDRLGKVPLDQVLINLIDNVDESALLHLIEQFHVAGIEGSTLAENDTNRRELIKTAIAMHRLKGTPAGLKNAIRNTGFGEITIIEGIGDNTYNGGITHDGLRVYGGGPGDWAKYHIYMERAITNDQADKIRELCAEYAPARCLLVNLVYTGVAMRYNAKAAYNGSYNHGAA